ncbi:MAG TPA: SRPBCC family protein [Rhizomicrobium sp.]
MRSTNMHRPSGASKAAKLIWAARPFSIFILFAISVAPASAASLSRSVEVSGTPSAIWSKIGAFCAIKDWHPAIATCAEDGKTPATRTLVTKDGTATFVELQTANSEAKHLYGYTFVSSPLPVTHYQSILKVTAMGGGHSVVTWSGEYKPDSGKEKDADAALSGIYEAGLEAIKAKFAN